MTRLSITLLLSATCAAFTPSHVGRVSNALYSAVDVDIVIPTLDDLNDLKAALVFVCNRVPAASVQEVRDAVEKVEIMGGKGTLDWAQESCLRWSCSPYDLQIGIGQASATSDILSGEWELLWSPEDATRSSPFFWAFRKAFPDNADQIYGITDSIPAPLKEIGPAFQTINFVPEARTGQFVSRVKVATLGGLATSIMTTRGTIIGVQGLGGIRVKIETTKPEKSTVLQTLLGPLGAVVNENLPAFPSGDALEQIRPGSSEVVIRNTYVDDSVRISRNDEAPDQVYVWRRREFASFEML
ncbi:hypothetical protein MHU86_1146 [Fragilaria crotonensis]|nr:hypothetical protein MHU86_1146 [Fragilaria crotonensis]